MDLKKFIVSYLVFTVFSSYFPPIPGISRYPLKKRPEKGHDNTIAGSATSRSAC
jgi:hypothetical protein